MMQADQPVLVVEGGPSSDTEIPLSKPNVTMGRQSGNDVVAPEAGVSRQHAEIVQKEGSFYVHDLASTNGTFVNTKKIDNEYLLKDGDRIRLGAGKIIYVFRSPTAGTLAMTLVQPAEGATETWVVKDGPATQAVKTSDVSDEIEAPPQDEDVYEGSVRLRVKAEGSMALVVTFVQQLRQKSELRLQKMVNNRQGGTDIWLALREPIRMLDEIGAMDHVSSVTGPESGSLSTGDEGPLIDVLLAS